jgi:sirohydrochlorin ferrochelatase
MTGRCNVSHFRQTEAMVEAGSAKSLHQASHVIAEQTGESERAVEERVYRGKKEVSQLEEKSASSLTPHKNTETPAIQSPEPEIKADRKHTATGKKKGGKREGTRRERTICSGHDLCLPPLTLRSLHASGLAGQKRAPWVREDQRKV